MLGTEGNLFSLMKFTYQNPKARIIFHGETWEPFSLRETKVSFDIILEVLPSVIHKEKSVKTRVKLTLAGYDLTFYPRSQQNQLNSY